MIEGGLSSGEEVIVYPSDAVKEGTRVKALRSECETGLIRMNGQQPFTLRQMGDSICHLKQNLNLAILRRT